MKILKHTNSGTRAALPSYIWDGLNAGGFDPRLGKGYYGVGAYFAVRNRRCSREVRSQKQLLVARTD